MRFISELRRNAAKKMETLIGGKYKILAELDRGGMGVVYKGHQISLDRIVAIKMLSPELARDPAFLKRFQQEAQMIARLTHPNILTVHDVIEFEGSFYIVMEYLEGETLQERVMGKGALAPATALRILIQVAEALNYAHQHGIVHRDIKPANIMLLEGDHVKVMDFGIARLAGSSPQTHPGTSLGTPEFMSPEQVKGEKVDLRTDIYSLGCVLFHAVTGKYPFQGETSVATALMHEREAAPRPSRLNATVPKHLDDIVIRSMAKNPEKRFASALEFAEALSKVLKEIAEEARDSEASAPIPHGETAVMSRYRVMKQPTENGEHERQSGRGLKPCLPRSELRSGTETAGRRRRIAVYAVSFAMLLLIVGAVALNKYLRPALAEKSYHRAMEMAQDGTAPENEIFDEFEKSIRYNPRYYQAWRDYGGVLFWYGHFKDAAQKLEKALSFGERDEERDEIVKMYNEAKRFASETKPEATPSPEPTPLPENTPEPPLE
jgi:serine/threonine protein kinase